MSDEHKQIDDGGPAFPIRPVVTADGRMSAGTNRHGMSLRDYFAAKVICIVAENPDAFFIKGRESSEHRIENLGLSVRARKALWRKGVETVDQLCELTRSELLAYSGFGQTSLREIQRKLNELGRSLGDNKKGDVFNNELAAAAYAIADAMLLARKESTSPLSE